MTKKFDKLNETFNVDGDIIPVESETIIEKVEKGMDLDQVFQLFAGDQNIASQIDSIRPQVEELSGYIVEGHTNAEIIERAFALFGVNQQRQEQNAKIALFRKQVEAQKRIEEVREKI